jgi:hypothetical protein
VPFTINAGNGAPAYVLAVIAVLFARCSCKAIAMEGVDQTKRKAQNPYANPEPTAFFQNTHKPLFKRRDAP